MFSDLYSGQNPQLLALFPRLLNDPEQALELHRQLQAASYPKKQVSESLYRYNKALQAPQKTLDRIRLLENPGSTVVITGQQCGLLTGPLYTIYKALSAIAVARKLEQVTGKPVIPIFWSASDDHDTAEIDHITLPNGLVTRKLSVPLQSEGRPAATIPLSFDLEQFIGQLAEVLPTGDYWPQITCELRECWEQSDSFATWFASLISRLLSRFGLVIFDPNAPDIRSLCSPFFQQTIRQMPQLQPVFQASSAHYQQACQAQPQVTLPAKSSFLFIIQDQRRTRLDYLGAGLFAAEKLQYTKAELMAIAENNPEKLSPNAPLRPLMQDYLLPNMATICGPGELKYHAQLPKLYELYAQTMPFVIPRAGITLLESKVCKSASKYGLKLASLPRDKAATTKQVLLRSDQAAHTTTLHQAEATATAAAELAASTICQSFPELKKAGKQLESQLKKEFGRFESRYAQRLRDSNKLTTEQIDKIYLNIYPEGKPQERIFNIYNYLSRYGHQVIDQMFAEICAQYSPQIFLEIQG